MRRKIDGRTKVKKVVYPVFEVYSACYLNMRTSLEIQRLEGYDGVSGGMRQRQQRTKVSGACYSCSPGWA